mmetsp:Transcript_17758/g.55993  ORF Transcript_17758/g.55993 Transcript_17758/m.55993 type:complete len:181 (-) Transcript_17758:195-737(-)
MLCKPGLVVKFTQELLVLLLCERLRELKEIVILKLLGVVPLEQDSVDGRKDALENLIKVSSGSFDSGCSFQGRASDCPTSCADTGASCSTSCCASCSANCAASKCTTGKRWQHCGIYTGLDCPPKWAKENEQERRQLLQPNGGHGTDANANGRTSDASDGGPSLSSFRSAFCRPLSCPSG